MKKLLLRVSFGFLLLCVLKSVLGTSTSSGRISASERRHLSRLQALKQKRRVEIIYGSNEDLNLDSTPVSDESTDLWYTEQCKDHNKDCTQTSNQWSQRYWKSMKHYKAGGPIFIMLGGETPVEPWIKGGQWAYQAIYHNAAMVVIEHRFYGQSFPTPKTDRSPEAMELLTSRQALSDYAKFVTWFKSQNPKLKDAKVVAFGGSYPGFLTAWFRALYPDVINVAVASSAPLRYELEYPELVGKTSEVIQDNNPACFERLKTIFTCMEGIVFGKGCDPSLSYVTIGNISQVLNICNEFGTEIDKENFFTAAGRRPWANNNPGTTNLPTGARCDMLMSQNSRDVVKLYGKFLQKSGLTLPCNRRRKRQYPPPDKDDGGYLYSYNWQICNEFVNLQVADPKLGMLGTQWGQMSETWYQCHYYYPTAGFTVDKLRMNAARTNQQYPMKGYNGTCVIFTNGSWDPWSTRGFTKKSDTSDKNSVYYIKNGEHMEDFSSPSTNQYAKGFVEPVQMRVKLKIGVYLNNPDC